METFYAFIVLSFPLLCPVVTMTAVVGAVCACHRLAQRVVIGILIVASLVLLFGPAITEDDGTMPWWFSYISTVGVFHNADYLVWQYALVCMALYVAVSVMRPTTDDAEADLLSLCRGDKGDVVRRTQVEMSKNPTISRNRAMARAAASIRRDG